MVHLKLTPSREREQDVILRVNDRAALYVGPEGLYRRPFMEDVGGGFRFDTSGKIIVSLEGALDGVRPVLPREVPYAPGTEVFLKLVPVSGLGVILYATDLLGQTLHRGMLLVVREDRRICLLKYVNPALGFPLDGAERIRVTG